MRAILVVSALIALTLIVFAVWPGIDLAVSHVFYDRNGGFIDGALEGVARDFFRRTPFVVLAAFAALYGLRRAGVGVPWAPTGRGVLFLVATIAIGPGLIVNLGLKDHTHRPRPTHVVEFGGSDEFRPWRQFDGACRKNCSFVSGEAASAFWMTAPASLAPPPARAPALAAALVFGACASLLRVASGGHFLSDVLLGGLISLLVVAVARRAFWPRAGP